jgi:hypothetical protein
MRALWRSGFSGRYCRFLCPLGGVLALDRHLPQSAQAPSKCAIPVTSTSAHARCDRASGEIKTAECFSAWCQVEYYDDSAARRWCGLLNAQ